MSVTRDQPCWLDKACKTLLLLSGEGTGVAMPQQLQAQSGCGNDADERDGDKDENDEQDFGSAVEMAKHFPTLC